MSVPRPNKNFELGNFRISIVFFQISQRFQLFIKCQKNGAITRAPQLAKKKRVFSFLAIFDKNTGHRVTKFYPVSRIYITYKFYFMIFSLARRIFLSCFHIHDFDSEKME